MIRRPKSVGPFCISERMYSTAAAGKSSRCRKFAAPLCSHTDKKARTPFAASLRLSNGSSEGHCVFSHLPLQIFEAEGLSYEPTILCVLLLQGGQARSLLPSGKGRRELLVPHGLSMLSQLQYNSPNIVVDTSFWVRF